MSEPSLISRVRLALSVPDGPSTGRSVRSHAALNVTEKQMRVLLKDQPHEIRFQHQWNRLMEDPEQPTLAKGLEPVKAGSISRNSQFQKK
jgi:hypothetical protein